MSSFSLFNSLPTELRLKIWEACLPDPRLIAINLSISAPNLTSTAPPILLSINSESRSVVLTHYRLCFTSASQRSGTYLDPRLDTILLLPPCPPSCYALPNCFECFHFSYHSRLAVYDSSSVKEVENVAVRDFAIEGLASLWMAFLGMKRLLLIVDDHWTVGVQGQHPLKKKVEGLLGKAREDVLELRGLDAVEVRVVRGQEMLGRENEVGLRGAGHRSGDGSDLSW